MSVSLKHIQRQRKQGGRLSGRSLEQRNPDGPEPEPPTLVALIEHRVHPVALVPERSVVADGAVVTVAVLPADIGPLRLLPTASGLRLHPAGAGALVRRI